MRLRLTSQGTKIEIEIEIEIQYSVRNPPQSDLHVSALVIVLVVIALFVIEPTVYAFFLTSDSPPEHVRQTLLYRWGPTRRGLPFSH